MRVISGELKGRKIFPVRGVQIRYTSDRVKESFFGMIGESVAGKNFLDLCAGSGNVGIEALSRGAQHVAFVDVNSHCVEAISDNLRRLGVEPHSTKVSLTRSALETAIRKFAKEKLKFQQIFIDPPYESKVLDRCLREIAFLDILSLDGHLTAEHRKTEVLKDRYGPMFMARQKKYGDTVLSFYKLETKR